MMKLIYEGMDLAREVMKGLKETAYHCKHTGNYRRSATWSIR
ncbi:hypothetical protein [Paenibacillus tyrfis]|nr:hypothetical protein [Paenibacillus tyrfis]